MTARDIDARASLESKLIALVKRALEIQHMYDGNGDATLYYLKGWAENAFDVMEYLELLEPEE